jgi:hypothetical protein
MAAVSPVVNTQVAGVPRVIWEGLSTAGTVIPYVLKQQHGLSAAAQVVGDFGGATVALEVSNDGTNWEELADAAGVPLAFTTAALVEISTSAVFIAPKVTGGTADDIDVILTLRGSTAL